MKTINVLDKDTRAGSSEQEVASTDRVEVAKPAYVRPQIVKHSAEKTENAGHPVNACASFVP